MIFEISQGMSEDIDRRADHTVGRRNLRFLRDWLKHTIFSTLVCSKVKQITMYIMSCPRLTIVYLFLVQDHLEMSKQAFLPVSSLDILSVFLFSLKPKVLKFSLLIYENARRCFERLKTQCLHVSNAIKTPFCLFTVNPIAPAQFLLTMTSSGVALNEKAYPE